MRRLFLDANVLFTAAHNPAGKAALVIEEGIRGRWALATSRLAVDEATHNLRLKYPEAFPRLDPLLAAVRVLPHRPARACPVELPPKDRPILQAALDCRATHLLTGDVAHHPVQMAHLGWSSTADSDPIAAAGTRRELFSRFADTPILVIGGHFDAGFLKRDSDAFRLEAFAEATRAGG